MMKNCRSTTSWLKSRSKRAAILLLLCLSAATATAQTKAFQSTIDTERRQQTFEGWGVSLCWWAHKCGQWTDAAKLDTLLTWLASPQHLGYNIFRYNIGGGDDPQWRHCTPHHFGLPEGKGLRAEIPGFQDERGGAYLWERDSAQRRVLLWLCQLRQNDVILEAFSNSPPYFLTKSGCVGGAKVATDDNLPRKNYRAFAQYLIDVCRHYRDQYGIVFRTIDPFNEPETDYWFANGSQEGCHFSTKSQIRFLRVFAPMLQASGLATQISASDETSIRQSLIDLQAYSRDGQALQAVGQWNTHSYKGNNADREALRSAVQQAGKRLWMSESGDGGRGLHGNLMMAQRIINDIRILQPNAWVDWQYVEEFGDQWSLVRSDWNHEQFQRVKNYYVRYQFSHYITPGSTILATDHPSLLAAQTPSGALVIVALNTERQPAKHRISLRSPHSFSSCHATRTSHTEDVADISAEIAAQNGEIALTLPPLSITTINLNP